MLSDESKKTDYKPSSTEDMVIRMVREAAAQAAVAAATTLHHGDPVQAAKATASALVKVFESDVGGKSTPASGYSENKFTTQAILESLSGPD